MTDDRLKSEWIRNCLCIESATAITCIVSAKQNTHKNATFLFI